MSTVLSEANAGGRGAVAAGDGEVESSGVSAGTSDAVATADAEGTTAERVGAALGSPGLEVGAADEQPIKASATAHSRTTLNCRLTTALDATSRLPLRVRNDAPSTGTALGLRGRYFCGG